MYPNRLVMASTYGTLKNDSQGTTLTVAVTSGTVVDPGVTHVVGTDTATVGTINAPLRARCHTSKFGNWQVGTILFSNIDVKFAGDLATYTVNLYGELIRINATQLRLYVSLDNNGPGPDITIQENQTITFVVSTFLSSFD